MGTVFLYTLRESLSRRMGIVMLFLSVIIPAYYIYSLILERAPDGTWLVYAGQQRVTADVFTRFNWNTQLGFAQGLWTYVGIFVAASLLSSYLEKGWADMLFTKGVSRWKFLLGRIAGSLALFVFMIFMVTALPALYISFRTGISAKLLLLALGTLIFSFFCTLTLMAMVSVATPNVAMLVIVAFMQLTFSTVLVNRAEVVEFFNRKWLLPVLDFIHAALPRSKEVANIGVDLLNRQPVESWSAFYWSAGLAVAYLLIAAYSLHRKPI